MKYLPLATLVLLAGCGPAVTDRDTLANVEAEQRRALAEDGAIECGADGKPLVRECTIEKNDSPDGLVLTVRHPDGAFRRFLVTRDGRGVVSADGAEAAKVTVVGPDQIEVEVSGDRYRLPATVKSGAGKAPAPKDATAKP